MKITERVIAILNEDDEAKRKKTAFERKAAEHGLTGADYEEAKETFLMSLVIANKDAMNAMTEDMYAKHNAS